MTVDSLREIIRQNLEDVNWKDSYWLDDLKLKEPFRKLSGDEIDKVYIELLKKRVSSMSRTELKELYDEQMEWNPDARNYLMIKVLEEALYASED